MKAKELVMDFLGNFTQGFREVDKRARKVVKQTKEKYMPKHPKTEDEEADIYDEALQTVLNGNERIPECLKYISLLKGPDLVKKQEVLELWLDKYARATGYLLYAEGPEPEGVGTSLRFMSEWYKEYYDMFPDRLSESPKEAETVQTTS